MDKRHIFLVILGLDMFQLGSPRMYQGFYLGMFPGNSSLYKKIIIIKTDINVKYI